MASQPTPIDEIFAKAAEITGADERSSYLDQACGDDAELRQRVERLLAAQSKVDSFLEAPAPGAELGVTTDSSSHERAVSEQPGTQIGPYKLLQKLGEGGMGVVYMAEQSEPVERRVALKIIKPGMDTRRVIARFEAERQALAMMDHPSIAKVFEAGTTDSGRPYFVMEMVKGVPITNYCDDHRLDPRQRLELFQQVCHAVQHAHQKGIIHRDIKPTNVLVAEYDDRAVPKIIDFGVAKAIEHRLTDKTMFTEVGTVVGTIEYMSPEQAKLNQLDIDTRSDIYSLGVLLYELLTGETPFDRQRLRSAAFDEMLRILREEEPPRPSLKLSTSQSLPSIAANRHVEPKRLSLLVRGELDWIVMKALEKERSRRYDTANAFADDIANYLNDEAVQACPPSAAYRFSKFVRRNKAPLVVTSVVAIGLITLTIGSLAAAKRFEKLAGDNAQLVTEKTTLADNLRTALRESQANLVRAQEQEQEAKQNFALATSEQARAEGNLDLALQALDAVYLDAIGTEKLLGEPVSKRRGGGNDSGSDGLSELEKELLKRGLDFYDQFASHNAGTNRAEVQTAQAYYRVGLLHGALGDLASAEAAYRQAVERFTRLVTTDPSAIRFTELSDAYDGLARVLREWPEARKATQSAIEACSKAIELDPNNAWLFKRRADYHHRVGDYEKSQSDIERALQLAPEAVPLLLFAADMYWHALLKKDHDRVRELLGRVIEIDPNEFTAYEKLGVLEGEQGRVKACLAHLDRALELEPTNASVLYYRAVYRAQTGMIDAARTDLERADALDSGDRGALYTRARAYAAVGNYKSALEGFNAFLTSKPNARSALNRRAELHLRHGHYQEAVDDFTKVVSIAPDAWTGFKNRGTALFHLGQYNEALTDLTKSLELNPTDTSVFFWIPPSNIARCPDESFKQGFLELADRSVSQSSDPMRARRDRIGVYLGLGQYAKAQQDFHELLTPDNQRHFDHYLHAILALQTEDDEGYRQSCRRILAQFADTEQPLAANFAAWTCVLLPDAVMDYSTVIDLATRATEAQPTNDQFLNTLGAALYRSGQHEAALAKLLELSQRREEPNAQSNSSPAYTWYFLAMTHAAAGQTDEAQAVLERANTWTEKVLSDEENPPAWNRRLTLELLRREASEKIGPKASP